MTEDSSKIDVKITVQRTIYKRVKYVKDCDCEESPKFLTAPKPEGIIPKSLYTNAFWCLLLVLKFFFQIPLNRQIRIIDMYHYEPNASTIIGGFKKLLPLMIPLYEKLKAEILKIIIGMVMRQDGWFLRKKRIKRPIYGGYGRLCPKE